ncbi:MAG: hypothetical protein ACM3S3_08450 [Candidatus Doudnabacteria bacterium]
MATRPLALHLPAAPPAARRGLAARFAKLATELVLAAAIVAAGAVAVILLLLLVVIATPLAAALVAWLVWRSGDVASRQASRVRARLRRRARALGLVVLAGSQPGVLRLAATSDKHAGSSRVR